MFFIDIIFVDGYNFILDVKNTYIQYRVWLIAKNKVCSAMTFR